MKIRLVSGNVFSDLGLADAEKLKIKTGLVIEIRKAMCSRGLTHIPFPLCHDRCPLT